MIKKIMNLNLLCQHGKSKLLSSVVFICIAMNVEVYAQQVWNFSFTGNQQTFSVPSTGPYKIEVWGAQGGNGLTTTGGRGGYAVGTTTLTGGSTVFVFVGGAGTTSNGGYNGGGAGGIDVGSAQNGGGGGGASDVRVGGTGLANRIIVAGGGAGGGRNGTTGVGGGLTGTASTNYSSGYGGGPGTQVSGGLAFTTTRGAQNGSLGLGGRGSTNFNAAGGGGGGGGYYGGGGGTSTANHGSGWSAGGGGGSSYISGLTSASTVAGNASMPNPTGGNMVGRTGNGYVRITLLYGSSITSTTNVSCNAGNNGSLTVTVNGGTSPYDYAWSNGSTTLNSTSLTNTISSLVAGTYTVTITDNNNSTTTATATVTQPTAVSVTATSVNVSCFGGSNGTATASATGGTGNKTFVWNTGGTTATITGLSAGTYTVTATDANGCTATTTRVITQPAAAVSVTATSVNVSCNAGSNGSASATATGGTGNKTFLWSNGSTSANITGLAAGTYTVTATDANGCTATTTRTITQPTALSATATVTTNVGCNGGSNGSASATATGGTGTKTYAWSNGSTTSTATGLSAGTHTVTVTDANNCTTTATVSITEPTALTASTTNTGNVSCNGDSTGSASAAGNGGTAPYTYAWSNSAATAAITGLPAGSYTVTITDGNNCTASSTVAITEPTALVAAIDSQLNVACDPDTNGYASVLATGGTAPYTYAWSNGGSMISTNTLDTGAYMVTVTDALGCTQEAGDTIIAIDSIVPTVLTQNIMVYLDSSGVAMIDVMSIDSGSFDNCVVDTMYLDTNMFDCNAIGMNTVVLTVVDAVGNMASASAMVTVADTLAPVLMVQDVTIFLDANGNATLTAIDVDNGSMDNCGIDSMTVDLSSFTCNDLGTVPVMVTAVDGSGNSSMASVVVTIADNMAPMMVANDLTIYLDSTGNGSISMSAVNAGSSDNCDMFMMLSDSLFTCSDEGNNMVALIGTDLSGNIGVDSFMVTVIDTHNQIAAITGFMEREQGAVVDYMVDSVAGATYEWTVTNGTGVANGSMITVTWNADTTMGSLEVIQTTSLGCADTASNMITLWALGADDAIEAGMMIFPNPTRGEITLRSLAIGYHDLTVYDMVGNKVLELKSAEFGSDYKMDLSKLAKGQYHLVIRGAQQAVYSIVVQ